MPVELGVDKVSKEQLSLLEMAKREYPQSRIFSLIRVISDPDLQSGKETLHPGWVEICQPLDFLPVLEGISPEIRGQLLQIFGKTPLDSEVATIDPDTMRLVFLLGAGASKPTPSDIPTVKELLPDLLARAERLDRADLQRLADFCKKSEIDNIEDLLTAAQLSGFCSRNPAVLSLVGFLIYGRESDPRVISYTDFHYGRSKAASRDLSSVAFLQDTLQVLFGLLSSRMLPAQPNSGHMAIANYVHGKPESAITTNYDCCVDLALGSQEANFSYRIDFANENSSLKLSDSPNLIQPTSLIKLHGSLNWYYCETCQ